MNTITNPDINAIKNSIIFKDIDEKDILPMLGCLSPTKKSYKKGSYILNQGEYIDFVCLIISGSVRIENIDIWGNRKIMSELTKSDIFAESYACVTNEPLMVDAIASSDCVILTMNMNKVMTTCPSSCNFHNKLIKNMLSVFAMKNIAFTRKIEHITQKNTREKVLSYLNYMSSKFGSTSFEIPFNRQQLADYLSVERSALSSELSKMQADGLISYKKNKFTLHIKREQ